jgi:Fur family ferric uptake transcriptional regulator
MAQRESDVQGLGDMAYGRARTSSQRLAIAATVEDSAKHAFSAEDIASEVRRDSPTVGLATVYRAVAAMQEAGFIEAVGERDGATLYARCGHKGHHHHLVCTGCGAVVDIECPLAAERDGAGGFQVTGHSLVMHGLCPHCRPDTAGDEQCSGRN